MILIDWTLDSKFALPRLYWVWGFTAFDGHLVLAHASVCLYEWHTKHPLNRKPFKPDSSGINVQGATNKTDDGFEIFPSSGR